ncbi:MAG: hypothetical protein WAL50_10525, partial [Kineosporiaceae bacterium]
MRRLTITDRDRARRVMSLVTGGITIGAVAATGAAIGLAEHETALRTAQKKLQKAQAAAALQTTATTAASRAQATGRSTHVFSAPPSGGEQQVAGAWAGTAAKPAATTSRAAATAAKKAAATAARKA